ncbi:MAG: pro-sigmaK processing inhibitor BofA family protein [Lachnospiraceae bacterium]
MNDNERPHIFINFFIRLILGVGVIFFVNEYLTYRDISIAVGMNITTFLTCGIFGIPGVALLYGILFYQNM